MQQRNWEAFCIGNHLKLLTPLFSTTIVGWPPQRDLIYPILPVFGGSHSHWSFLPMHHGLGGKPAQGRCCVMFIVAVPCHPLTSWHEPMQSWPQVSKTAELSIFGNCLETDMRSERKQWV